MREAKLKTAQDIKDQEEKEKQWLRSEKIDAIGRAIRDTKPDSKEENRLLLVLDKMNLSNEEWDMVDLDVDSDRKRIAERIITTFENGSTV